MSETVDLLILSASTHVLMPNTAVQPLTPCNEPMAMLPVHSQNTLAATAKLDSMCSNNDPEPIKARAQVQQNEHPMLFASLNTH